MSGRLRGGVNHLSLSQAVEAVVNGQHAVTLDDAHPDGGADGGVHPSAGGADVHDGHVDVALVQRVASIIRESVFICGLGTVTLTLTSGGLMWANSL